MKRLNELIAKTPVLHLVGPDDPEINRLVYDSRQVAVGDCFFAVSGTQTDGHAFIESAVLAGAVAVVCQRLPEKPDPRVSYVVVEDTNAAMADMAAAFYEYPSRQLKLVGITGTNGKTTTVTLLYDLFHHLGYKVGLISTVVYRIDRESIESTHTTPDTIRLNEMMARMVEAGCEYCFMEVSSHAIVQERIRGLHFTGAIFSNITHDHLDYHKTFAEYIRAKKLFFDNLPREAFALVNIDDRNGRVMVQNTRAAVKTYSLQSMADFRCKILETHPDGMELHLDGNEVWVHFLGRFNAYNLLSVYATALLLGADRDEVLRSLSTLHPVSGRFEFVRAANGVTAIVDYAHTPDALEKVLQTIEELRRPNQQLLVICGCGGDRDKTKRPEMAQIAAKYATTAILTSDNPRHENPEAILDDMVAGLASDDRFMRITDRSEAIRTAAMLAKPGDFILIAGKGHENYQIIGDTKHHFDDKEEVSRAFELFAKK
ncbi:MAG TPA: UDP-N-acetylmuramoyl-L-alanyl-D-glutamate--2,6-diaminopimelate ligase [Candidatus Alistipes avicola]|uniref:UDP-N-acetylmuramoyl-L-alanyl-D-glutamate--2,6-diaminopimelate ligase n=1 Tax=Candidatus Alistipes avicola TaxID=2838432 RepID=A0A9D2ICN1_9BACT|nr:UDP-N-acetylmuramoyl-L-alanyl-D-glutamate--2,6-diaminopimelate ligase [uncultured Alistipes sp.]HJA98389.1 UDP-N-acetylmuramoyl-L-alanyl-D-glutamate--2,6-diaminopimelate ligase [Candidatus Alistipes avicola]